MLTLEGGATVSYAEYGAPDGRPVLALHGAPACRLMFSVADAEAKSRGLRFIAPDRPGYGLTPPDDRVSLSGRTEWLKAVVDALRLDRFAVLAVSGGSPYAVSLAALCPERIAALALVSPMGPVADYAESADSKLEPLSFMHDRFFMHMPYRTWVTHPLSDVGAWMYRHGPDFFNGLLPKLAVTPDSGILSQRHVSEVMRTMTLEAFRQGGGGGMADLEIFGRPWNVKFADVNTPALVWQGTEDHVVPPQAARWLARQLPRCELHSLDGAGHFWVFEHVGEVVDSLDRLMSQNGLPKARAS
jgi:pimeloyl-ACP methyl ester carboxylesterase